MAPSRFLGFNPSLFLYTRSDPLEPDSGEEERERESEIGTPFGGPKDDFPSSLARAGSNFAPRATATAAAGV